MKSKKFKTDLIVLILIYFLDNGQCYIKRFIITISDGG